MDTLLEDGDAFLGFGVVVVEPANPGDLSERRHECLRCRRELSLPGYLDRAAPAAEFGCAVLPVF